MNTKTLVAESSPFAKTAHPPERTPRLMRLEAVRGFAAAYVVVHHAHLSTRQPMRFLFAFGQEAVIPFFLMSGFVIFYASHRRGKLLDFGTYFNHRFRRIYPIFLVALALAYLAARIGAGELQVIGWPQLVGNLAMLQDLPDSNKSGAWIDTFAGNTPLWSLSYEWWFYMMFFPIVTLLTVWPLRQRAFVFLLSVFGFLSYHAIPNQISLFLSYFFIWWTGVELSREYLTTRTITWRGQLQTILLLACLVVLWSIPVAFAVGRGGIDGKLRPGDEPLLELRHFAAALVIVVVGIAWYRTRFVGFRKLLGPFMLVAPISYAVYAIHMPVMQLTQYYWPANGAVMHLILTIAVLAPLCYFLEVLAQRRLNQWFNRLLPSRASVTLTSCPENA